MKIARYWEKASTPAQMKSGRTVPVMAWGWSDSNREEALQRAQAAADRSAAWLEARIPAPHEYGEYDRPPREEIIREITGRDGNTNAVITRNSYGAQVLNTGSLMFIDVDLPPASVLGGLSRGIGKLFGRTADDPETATLGRIRETAARHAAAYSFRVYRTFAGFRVAVVNQPIAPNSSESRQLLDDFGSDRLYVKLCRTQECYRARLSPKFWRCGARRPPSKFPWDYAGEEETYRAWQRDYEARCQSFATCRFVEQIGRHSGDAELQSLVNLHDEMTRADSSLKLA